MTDRDTIRTYPTPTDVAIAAAELVIETAAEAIHERGRFTIGLAGGSTPAATYALLAKHHHDDIDWSNVHVYFGDERCVPPDHDDSNYRMAKQQLLEHVPIPAQQVFRMEAELSPGEAASKYEDILRSTFPGSDDRLDLLLLGMGTDGHTASLFPGTEALNDTQHWCVANHVPQLGVDRITLTYPFVNASRVIAFLITGASKTEMLKTVLSDDVDLHVRPSQGISPSRGTLFWLLDEDAAACIAQ